MPKKITKTTKKRVPKKMVESKTVEPVFEPEVTVPEMVPMNQSSKNRSALYGGIVVVAVIAGVILFKNGLLLSAVVNGRPIFSWQLGSQLMSRYGKQTLEGMITEKMIDGEAMKNNVSISQSDIDAREQEMIKQFGPNVKLDDLLKYQGLTKADLDSQIRIQLEVEKILSKDVKVSDSDVSNYIASNSGKLTATDEAAMKDEARKALTQEELTKKIQPWFNELKNKSKIVRFIQ
jgi:hypothetical protein